MTNLIFGANGQDGKLLADRLERDGEEVARVTREYAGSPLDISDRSDVADLIAQVRPRRIFQLAAVSSARHSAMWDNHAAIDTATRNILEASRRCVPKAKIFLPGSALQFQNDESPVNEDTPFDAGSAYAVSRIHITYLARYFRREFAQPIYVGFLFHHDSAFRGEQHVNMKIASAARRIAKGQSERLEIGDLHVEKEFNHAADIIDAILLVMNQSEFFEVVIGSGRAHSLAEWTRLCFDHEGLDYRDHVVEKPGFKADFKRLVSDPRRLLSMGWRPQHDIKDLVRIMMGADDPSH